MGWPEGRGPDRSRLVFALCLCRACVTSGHDSLRILLAARVRANSLFRSETGRCVAIARSGHLPSARMRPMPKKPETPTAAMLEELLVQIGDAAGDHIMRQALSEMGRQTYVGGKRVDPQELPQLPERPGTTVHLVKVNLYGARPPVWRRLEIPSSM